jgi:hypothetical protein
MTFKKLSELTEKTTALVNGDYFAGVNSEASPVEGMITKWSLIMSTLKTYFDTVYQAAMTKAAASDVATGSDDAKYLTSKAVHDGITHRIRGTVSNPQAVYTQRAQIPLFRTEGAVTITRIHIETNQTAQQLAGDLKFADDVKDGSFANATVIDVCDTTSGDFLATSGFDDATIASGKEVYFQLDSSPNAAIKDFKIEVFYTMDTIT